MRQQRPNDPGVLVGQRHRGHVFVAPRDDRTNPAAGIGPLAYAVDDRPRAMDQQRSQVGIASLAHAEQVGLPT